MIDSSCENDIDPRLRFLRGGGQMGALIREFRWEDTDIGSPRDWPFTLKTVVGIILSSSAPMYVAWGPRFIQLYNDAYAPILGQLKHPQALGQTTPETWREIWDFVGPLFEDVMVSGKAVSMENKLFPMQRNGYLEECYFNFAYSPIIDEHGTIGGVICTCWETTDEVVNNRRTECVKLLVEGLISADKLEGVTSAFENTVASSANDLPFATWYEPDIERNCHKVLSRAGHAPDASFMTHQFRLPVKIGCETDVGCDWPNHFFEYSENPDPDQHDAMTGPPRTQVAFPLFYSNCQVPDGVLVFLLNSSRPNDQSQKQFLGEIKAQIEAALRRVTRNESELRESLHQRQLVMNAVPCLLWTSDQNNECNFFNNAWLEFKGRTYHEEILADWKEGIHGEDIQRVVLKFQTAFANKESYTAEYRLRRADGMYRWILEKSTPRFDIKGQFLGYIGTCLDITDYKNASVALTKSEARYKQIVENAQEGICVIDSHARMTFANPRLEEMLGWSHNEMTGRLIFDFMDEDVKLEAASYINHRKDGVAEQYEFQFNKKDGSKLWALVSANPFSSPDDDSPGSLAMLIDITERKENERRIEFLATHDSLTGLPNRALITDKINQSIQAALRAGLEVGLIFVNVDHFKYINDSYGHSVGNEIIKAIALNLSTLAAKDEIVARIGGDEFVLLLPSVPDGMAASTDVAKQIIGIFGRSINIGALELKLSASIGISCCPTDGQSAAELLKHADTAMYRAKEEGRNRFKVYAPEMSNRAKARALLEGELRKSLLLNQFELHYQPQVGIATGKVTGMEALIRWRHPTMGMIAPDKFIPVAEETGQIIAIGEWVLRTACIQNKLWQSRGMPHLTVAVNLSALQLKQIGFVELVAKVLEESSLEPACLELELTESMLMDKSQSVVSTLADLSGLGVSLSMDDFGTGYSNLGYIQSFPLNQIKIDRSFVKNLPDNRDSAAITTAIMSMGRSLGLRIIAEGVETAAQAEFLSGIGCEHAQGYLYSPPLNSMDFEAWVCRSISQ